MTGTERQGKCTIEEECIEGGGIRKGRSNEMGGLSLLEIILPAIEFWSIADVIILSGAGLALWR
jgi:hypothetical protein